VSRAAHTQPSGANPKRRLTGRQPRRFDMRMAHYSAARLRARALPQLPRSVHWTANMPADLGMMLNGYDALNPSAPQLGCCPIAGLHHARQVWSYNAAGNMVTDPNADVLADYEAMCGYVLGDPATDQGGNLQTVLGHAMRDGITTAGAKDRLLGAYEIDPRQLLDVARIIDECGVAYIGLDMPASWAQAQPGDVWNVDGPGADGHCVGLTGYEMGPDDLPQAFDARSWGLNFTMTRGGFQAYCDEAYGLVDAGWIAATGKAPAGLSIEQIQADMAAIA
jgi:hypothetical protein